MRMDADSRLNRELAHILDIPLENFVDDFKSVWKLVDFATRRQVEFSLFAMVYDHKPIYMASFIRGHSQRTSTGDCPRVATCKAFLMMFSPSAEENGDFPNRRHH